MGRRKGKYSGINGHYKEWKTKPLLSAGEEVELINEIRNGNEHAREELIASNIKLVYLLASFIPSPEGCTQEDKVQQGLLGLMRATEEYRPEENTRFSTCANWWIRQAIHNPKSKLLKTPSHLRSLEVAAYHARKEYVDYCGSEPSIDYLAERISKEKKLDIGQVTKELKRLNRLKIQLIDFSEQSERDFFPITDKPLRYEDSYEWRKVQDAIEILPLKEKKVIKMRYTPPPMSLEEVGYEVGLTKQGAQQVEARAIKKLQTVLGVNGTKDFHYPELSLA